MYSNWAPGEPDADLNEDFVEMFATAQWNDSTDGEALNQGYLVEYLSTRPRWRRRSSSDRNAGNGRLAWRAGRRDTQSWFRAS